MTKARVLADFISDGSPLADGTISVAEVSGAAPLASPTFSGTVTVPNIVTAGNVDGRDVSVDGTKLDGVEASADVTDATNVTAAGALMDSELTNIAAVKALNQGLATTDEVAFDNTSLNAIATDISDTAVDVFVYDTSKDSDGGAWRKRTQHTSWYNEAASATRGSRKEFPAVAVIVLENNKLTIYDGDDPDLPMWMVFNSGTNSNNETVIRYFPLTATRSVNGRLSVGSLGGLNVIDFISEQNTIYYGANTYRFIGRSIADRNVLVVEPTHIATTNGILHDDINDVDMTVLPNAPIDAATGLPVPTIAVATTSGVSVILDNGTVVDIANDGTTGGPVTVAFYGGNKIMTGCNTVGTGTRISYSYFIPNADTTAASTTFRIGKYVDSTTSGGDLFYSTTPSNISKSIAYGDNNIASHSDGVGLLHISENESAPSSGMTNFTTSDYNTGWMNGAIKLATLSDTDTANVTGAELVTNGTFASNTASWTAASGTTLSVSNNQLVIASSGTDYGKATQPITLEANTTYVFTVYIQYSSSIYYTRYNLTGTGYSQTLLTDGVSNLGWHSVTFTTGSTVPSDIVLNLGARNDVTNQQIDNISIRKAEPDRSVNGNGLQVFGTVTKTAVATGADLVGYSGFSSGNYIQQPYNSDLDFGTGDFSVTFWFNGSGAGNTNLWERGAATGQKFGILTVNGYIYLTGFGANIPIGSPHANAGDASWGHVVLLREAGVWKAYLNGEPVAWAYTNAATLTNTAAVLHLGGNVALTSFANTKKLALMRFSATIPTAAQVAKIYNDEKHLFQENAQATLYGSSDAVTALAHDDTTDLLHVGTSAGRSVFQGLRRVDNTTDAVGAAISASNNLVAED